MARKRYKFNPKTLTYEVISMPFRIRFYRVLRKMLIAFILASVVNMLFSYFFYTPKMYRINQHRNELTLKYSILSSKIASAAERLDVISHRDNNVYRTLFAVDTLGIAGVHTPYPQSKYEHFANDRFAPMISPVWAGLDALSRRLYAESVSLDQLVHLADNKGKMAESIPAILPINKRWIKNIGSFGLRTDPVTRRRGVMHQGMDFSGTVGTPIYATGNGRVMFQPTGYSGYGKQIMIDHGFGYKTRYAHLSRITVMPGQTVKRGEKIGELGNTGKSTGPHVHYEVIRLGNPVDPLNYFSKEMSNADFMSIIESAKETTFEVD